MKEFDAQTGGRYTYVDDIKNLQDLSLAFGEIFSSCDNFIISGCQVSGDKISPGYVYLNGKIRQYSGATGINKWPQYIYEHNRIENVAYASGTDKVGRQWFGCISGDSVPTSPDAITKQAPVRLQIQQSGNMTLKDAFFGKYALLLEPMFGKQIVNGTVEFTGDVLAKNNIQCRKVNMSSNGNDYSINCNSQGLFVESINSSKNYKFHISEEGVEFSVDSTPLMTLTSTEIVFDAVVKGKSATFGGTTIKGGEIYNSSTNTDKGTLSINVKSDSAGHFRDTIIGNGKGESVIHTHGNSKQTDVNGELHIKSGMPDGVVMYAHTTKSNARLKNVVTYKDSNAKEMGTIGYVSNSVFQIDNKQGTIVLQAADVIDLKGTVKENGVVLSDKYTTNRQHVADMADKANVSDVYSKSQANRTFGEKNGGLLQFLKPSSTSAEMCNEIGALTASAATKYARKDELLADMINSAFDKKKIRDNIGAAGKDEVQLKPKDTGWIYVHSPGLYVRQIGHMVSIQGRLHTAHQGVAFTLPFAVDAPPFAVHQTIGVNNKRSWRVSISAGSHNCMVQYCSGSCGKDMDFSLTYMV